MYEDFIIDERVGERRIREAVELDNELNDFYDGLNEFYEEEDGDVFNSMNKEVNDEE